MATAVLHDGADGIEAHAGVSDSAGFGDQALGYGASNPFGREIADADKGASSRK